MTHINGFNEDLIQRVNTWLGKHIQYDRHGEAEKVLPRLWDRYVNDWYRANEGDKAAYGAALTGVLLALVREAWGDPLASVACVGSCWVAAVGRAAAANAIRRMFNGVSEAEALVVALEAAT